MCSEPGFGASVSGSPDDDRRRLAVKAQALGREALAQIASVATPATLLRWYRWVLPPSSVGGCRVTCSCARVWGPDFERRSSFGDAGWADHTVPDVQRHLGVHADILNPNRK